MDNIYLLYGESIRDIQNKRKEIIENSHVDDFNISIFDMEQNTIEKVIEDAYTIPFLSESRVVVMMNSIFLSTTKEKIEDDTLKKEKRDFTKLIEYINNPVDSTILIIECPKFNIDTKNPVVSLLKGGKRDFSFPLASKDKIAKYVDEILKTTNHEITLDAKELLLKRIQDDPLGYKNEIEKLLLYLNDKEKITIDIIKPLITETDNENIYSLMNAISSNDKKRALDIYYNLVDQDLEPIYILSSGQAYYILKEAKQLDYNKLSKTLHDLKDLDYNTKIDFKYGSDTVIGFELFLLKQ